MHPCDQGTSLAYLSLCFHLLGLTHFSWFFCPIPSLLSLYFVSFSSSGKWNGSSRTVTISVTRLYLSSLRMLAAVSVVRLAVWALLLTVKWRSAIREPLCSLCTLALHYPGNPVSVPSLTASVSCISHCQCKSTELQLLPVDKSLLIHSNTGQRAVGMSV